MLLPRFALVVSLAVAASFAGAQAAELGEAVVRSHIGHNLIADIELTGMQDPAVPVLVRLAGADVYRGANIAMSPVLKSLQLSVMRRDGRQFLHVISTTPVQAEHLNLFLDLSDGGRRHLRAVTLWLTPDPQPVLPPPPAPVVAPVVPAKPVVEKPVAEKPVAAKPLLPRAIQSGAPAVCPPVDQQQLRTCAALDYKNGMLQARIVELEEKVKALQVALDSGAAAPVPSPSVSAPVAKPKPKPMQPTPKPEGGGFPWLALIGAVVALGLVAFLVRYLRRKKAQLKGMPPPPPGMFVRLRGRLRRGAAPDSPPAE